MENPRRRLNWSVFVLLYVLYLFVSYVVFHNALVLQKEGLWQVLSNILAWPLMYFVNNFFPYDPFILFWLCNGVIWACFFLFIYHVARKLIQV